MNAPIVLNVTTLNLLWIAVIAVIRGFCTTAVAAVIAL